MGIKVRLWDLVEKEMMNESDMDNYIINSGEDGYFHLLKVARFVPMMCTDTKDEDGKLIFVGDVLRCGGLLEVVRFGEYDISEDEEVELTTIGFYLESKYSQSPYIVSSAECHKIVGNIYENPELLGGDSQ